MILRTLVVGSLQTNCYLVACERTKEAIVIDPGADAQKIKGTAEDLGIRIIQIVLTHFHFDHILAVDALRAESGVPLAIHRDDAQHLGSPPALFQWFHPPVPTGLFADRLLQDGDILNVGDLRVEVLHTPGHSPGGISLWIAEEKAVFCGDTLFRDGIGRADFPGSSHCILIQSIQERLFALPDETAVYPGHGPSTTIGREKRLNPWVGSKARQV